MRLRVWWQIAYTDRGIVIIEKNAAPQCGHIGGKDNENAYILSFTKKNRLN